MKREPKMTDKRTLTIGTVERRDITELREEMAFSLSHLFIVEHWSLPSLGATLTPPVMPRE